MPEQKPEFLEVTTRLEVASQPMTPDSPHMQETVATRRRRYARAPSSATFVSLTPTKIKMLLFLAEMRFLSLPQIARLCCPAERRDLSQKSARRQMRALFDAGLVDVLPVSRAALAPAESPNDASLLYGSAPNVYTPTAAGVDALCKAGLRDKQSNSRAKPTYGPKNTLFLAHELAVRDVRVWLEEIARENGYELEAWYDGEQSIIDLARTQAPYQVRPDAWFVLRITKAVLVGLVEVDRGTERGDRRWGEKLNAYKGLFASGLLPGVTGYVNARVLVMTSSQPRRDALAALIAAQVSEGSIPVGLAERFWLADQSVLVEENLAKLHWRRPGTGALWPLVPA